MQLPQSDILEDRLLPALANELIHMIACKEEFKFVISGEYMDWCEEMLDKIESIWRERNGHKANDRLKRT